MIRDFTDEAKGIIDEAIDDSFSNRVTYSGRTGSYESELEETVSILGQNCVMNFTDIETEAKASAQKSRGTKTVQGEMKKVLAEIFEEARTADYNKSKTVADGVETTSSVYIETIKELVDSIEVSWMGTDATSIRYNMGRYNGVFDESIFSASGGYKRKIEGIGGGLYQQFYDSINVEEPYEQHQEQMENLYNFLQRDPSTVELWELQAVLAYLDTCVLDDDTMDYNKLSMILSGCYHEKGYSPLDGFVSYDTYYANDMLPYLAQHYNAYYNLRASQYSSIDPVKRYADLNAILTSTSIYYDEVKTYRYDEYGMPIDFGIVVAEETDASRRIVVSTVQPDYEETQAIGMLKFITHDNNIYISRADNNVCVQDSIMQFKENQKVDPTAALMDKFVSDHISQVEDKLEDGMKSGVETASKTAFGLSTKGPLAVYGFISGYVDEYNETVESNQKLEQDITYEEYSKYYNNLYMGGNVACCGSQDILFLNEKIDENQMQINLSYYNYEQGTNYSVEHMQEQYNNFTVGGDSSDLELYSDNLCNGDSGTQNMQNYNNAISIELGNTYVSTASEVQLQQAIENVNNRIDYYVEDILGKDISSASQEEIQNALNQVLSQPDTYNLNKDPEDMK